MNRGKQIEEMAKTLCEDYGECKKCTLSNPECESPCMVHTDCERLYNAGYRKIPDDHHKQVTCYTLGCQEGDKIKRDVAREIFEEIEENLNNLIRYYKEKRKYVTEVEYSEFEQRYCDIKIRTFEERLLKMSILKKKYVEEENHI